MVGISGFADWVGEEGLGDELGFGEGDGGEEVAGGVVVAPLRGDAEIAGGGEDFVGGAADAVAQGVEGEADVGIEVGSGRSEVGSGGRGCGKRKGEGRRRKRWR